MGWQGSSDTGDQVWRQGPRVEFNIFRETGLRDPAHQLSKKDCMKIGSHGACVRNLFPECVAMVPVSLWGSGG